MTNVTVRDVKVYVSNHPTDPHLVLAFCVTGTPLGHEEAKELLRRIQDASKVQKNLLIMRRNSDSSLTDLFAYQTEAARSSPQSLNGNFFVAVIANPAREPWHEYGEDLLRKTLPTCSLQFETLDSRSWTRLFRRICAYADQILK